MWGLTRAHLHCDRQSHDERVLERWEAQQLRCTLLLSCCYVHFALQSHDERVMARWEAQQAQWRAQAAALCAATGKQERDLTLSRGE